jgi:hypothetical protein
MSEEKILWFAGIDWDLRSTRLAFWMLKVTSPENAMFRIAAPVWQSCVTGLCRSQAT